MRENIWEYMSLGRGLGVVCSREVLRLLDFSDRERQIYDITAKWNLKKKWYKRSYFQNRNRLTDTENEGEGGAGVWEGW